ncbi:MAG: nitroreductase family deazaflavin-dependent oxidoreductase [Candidatus Hodarchaeales archaeon]
MGTEKKDNVEKAERIFPLEGTLFYKMIYEEKSKKKYYRWFKRINRIVVPLYRANILPLFGFGFRFVLIRTIGRKTGKKRYNPVEFFRIDGIIHVVSGWGKDANWFKNMMAHPDDVLVKVGFRKFKPKIEVLNETELLHYLKWLVTKHPSYGKQFGWDPKIDDPETANFSRLIKILRVIRLLKI